MYKIFCDHCRKYNYSASRIGKWLCSYCGQELQKKVGNPEPAGSKNEKQA
ncbi:MAG: hypothetical protein WBK53_09640 [Halanaerobiales bacterium]